MARSGWSGVCAQLAHQAGSSGTGFAVIMQLQLQAVWCLIESKGAQAALHAWICPRQHAYSRQQAKLISQASMHHIHVQAAAANPTQPCRQATQCLSCQPLTTAGRRCGSQMLSPQPRPPLRSPPLRTRRRAMRLLAPAALQARQLPRPQCPSGGIHPRGSLQSSASTAV